MSRRLLGFLIALTFLAWPAVSPGQEQEEVAWEAGEYTVDERADVSNGLPNLAFDEIVQHRPAVAGTEQTAAALHEILGQSKYLGETEEESPKETLLSRFWAWLSSLLGGAGWANPGWEGYVFVGILLLALAYLLTRLIWEFSRRQKTAYQDNSGGSDKVYTVEDLDGLAAEAAKRGDYRRAIRYKFKSVLQALALPTTALLTNYQLARKVKSSHPAAADSFNGLVVSFEDAWYGGRAFTAEQYDLAVRLAGQVEGVIEGRSQ